MDNLPVDDLNIALNEAALLDFLVFPDHRAIQIGLSVLTLDPDGNEPEDPKRALHLKGVSRLAASLRGGRWDDDTAPVIDVTVDSITKEWFAFDGINHLYGWKFFDDPNGADGWIDRLSLDLELDPESAPHTLDLSREGWERHLDIRVWFTELGTYRYDWSPIPIEEFTAGGRRWWDAFYSGSDIGRKHGLIRLRSSEASPDNSSRD